MFDTDLDGLPDSFEPQYGLDPLDNGTKTFNCSSGACIVDGNGSAVNGGLGDLDHDGIANLYEYIYKRPLNHSGVWTGGLSLNDPDEDDDGLIDGYAVTYATNGSDDNWTIVTDLIDNHTLYDTNETYNGTTNYTFWGEGYYGTDVRVADTDDDGKTDGVEAKGYNITLWLNLNGTWNHTTRFIQTDPASSDGDRDFLDDGDELGVVNHTVVGNQTIDNVFSDPTIADTDGDGLWDVYERRAGTSNPSQSQWTSPRRLDSDGDGLPDSVEPLWRFDTDQADDGINANDTDANGDNPADGTATLVLFRTELANYTGEVAAFVGGDSHSALEGADDPALTAFSYAGQVNNTTADLLLFEGQPFLTPDGRYVHYDDANLTLYLNDTFTGVILNFTLNNIANIDRSKVINTSYSYQFLESYDFVGYFSVDDDYDGLADNDETNGYNISINGITYNVTTQADNPDTDGDGLLDGSDIYLHISKLNSLANGNVGWSNWSGELYYEALDGDVYWFYGESTFGTHPERLDTDYDGLLDGFTFNLSWTADLNDTFDTAGGLANDNYSWNGSDWTLWYGEANWSTDPLDSDSDIDTIEDGAEVNGSAYLAGQWRVFNSTDPASNDTDGDEIDDNVEITGYTGPKDTYTLDPTAWSTDGDNISDKMEVDGWAYYEIWKSGHRVERTAYGNPLKTTTRSGLSGGPRLTDTVKFENGGDPWVDDSDNDGLLDYNDIDLTDENDTRLFVQDAIAPEIHNILFKAKRDGWDLYIEMRANVTDNSGSLNYVQMWLEEPGDHQFKYASAISGSPGWYSVRFSTGVLDWLKGGLLTMAGDVYTQDANYNWNLSSGSKRGELGKFLDALVEWWDKAKEAAAAVAAAVMTAVNVIVDMIEAAVKYIWDNVIMKAANLAKGVVDNSISRWENFADTTNQIDENHPSLSSLIPPGSLFLLSLIGADGVGDDLLKRGDRVQSALNEIIDIISPFLYIFDIKELLFEILDLALPESVMKEIDNIKNFGSDSIGSIMSFLIEKLFGSENSFLSLMGYDNSGSRGISSTMSITGSMLINSSKFSSAFEEYSPMGSAVLFYSLIQGFFDWPLPFPDPFPDPDPEKPDDPVETDTAYNIGSFIYAVLGGLLFIFLQKGIGEGLKSLFKVDFKQALESKPVRTILAAGFEGLSHVMLLLTIATTMFGAHKEAGGSDEILFMKYNTIKIWVAGIGALLHFLSWILASTVMLENKLMHLYYLIFSIPHVIFLYRGLSSL